MGIVATDYILLSVEECLIPFLYVAPKYSYLSYLSSTDYLRVVCSNNVVL